MEKEKLKWYLLLISFTIGLVLGVVHFEDILHGIGVFAGLLMPLFIGIILAFVLNCPYEIVRSWYCKTGKLKPRTSKILAIATVYILAFGAVALLICMIAPELIQNLKTFAESADEYLLGAQDTLNQVTAAFGLRSIDLTSLIETVNQCLGSFSNAIDDILSQLIKVTSNVISGIATTFISIALSVYILSGKERLMAQVKRALRVYLPRRMYHSLRELFQIVSQVFSDYVVGQCREAIILGSLCFVGMMILRLDYAGLISVIIAVTALVPIMGAYLGGTVAVILLLFVSPGKAFVFLIFLILLQQVEGNVIYPRVVGRKIGLPGMWVLLSISVWGGLFGIWGMLFGVPITTILYQLLKRNIKKRESTELQ